MHVTCMPSGNGTFEATRAIVGGNVHVVACSKALQTLESKSTKDFCDPDAGGIAGGTAAGGTTRQHKETTYIRDKKTVILNFR